MTLPLPTTVQDPEVQQNFDKIAQQFPVQGGNLAGVVRTSGAPTLIWGIVSAAGATLLGSGGFTPAHTATGTYTLTWAKPPFQPAVVGVDATATQRTFSYVNTSTTLVTVVISNGTGAKEDIAFSFVAVG